MLSSPYQLELHYGKYIQLFQRFVLYLFEAFGDKWHALNLQVAEGPFDKNTANFSQKLKRKDV